VKGAVVGEGSIRAQQVRMGMPLDQVPAVATETTIPGRVPAPSCWRCARTSFWSHSAHRSCRLKNRQLISTPADQPVGECPARTGEASAPRGPPSAGERGSPPERGQSGSRGLPVEGCLPTPAASATPPRPRPPRRG
jgi:hypothetical protein